MRPVRVASVHELGGSRAVFLAAGRKHNTLVTSDAAVWTRGTGSNGRLGHGDQLARLTPTRLASEMFGGLPARMVACGWNHTVVSTRDGGVWSFGCGEVGQLGHGDKHDKLSPTAVGAENFEGREVVVVAAGAAHTLATTRDGAVYSWGWEAHGCLGHSDSEAKLVPTRIAQLDGTQVPHHSPLSLPLPSSHTLSYNLPSLPSLPYRALPGHITPFPIHALHGVCWSAAMRGADAARSMSVRSFAVAGGVGECGRVRFARAAVAT